MTARFRPALYVGVLIGVALIAYGPGLGNQALLHHVPSDVTDPVLDNPMLRSLALWPKIFTGEFLISTGGHYRPLGYALFALANSTWPDAGAAPWHLATLALHLAAAGLLFVTLRMLAA